MSETPAAQPVPPEGRTESTGESWLSIVAAILLGIAATLTAFSAYQSGLRDGEVLEGYNTSSTALNDANYFYNQVTQTFAADQALFVEFATLAQTGPLSAADYITTLMRPELVEAIEWWEADEDAITPFDDDEANPYFIAEIAEAERLTAESEQAYDDATEAGDIGDKFELATVLLALTLFFAGIATLFRRRLVAVSLLGVSVVALTAGALQLATALTA